jgi:protein phosphatase
MQSTEPEAKAVRDALFDGVARQQLGLVGLAQMAVEEAAALATERDALAGRVQELVGQNNQAVGFNQQWQIEGARLTAIVARADVIGSYGGETKGAIITGPNFALHNSAGGPNTKYTNNEDSAAFVRLPNGQEVYIVSDGMGYHGNGEVASRFLIEGLTAALLSGENLYEAIIIANQYAVRKLAEYRQVRGLRDTGSGATLVVAIVDRQHNRLQVAHIGDSRCKIVQRDEAYHLTLDHSLKLGVYSRETHISPVPVPEGEITAFDNYEFANSNVITSTTGESCIKDNDILPPSWIRISEFELVPAPAGETSTLLLYSDGPNDQLAEAEITRITRVNPHPTTAAEGILQAALPNSTDNLTVIAVALPFRINPGSVSTNNYDRGTVPPPAEASIIRQAQQTTFDPLFAALQPNERIFFTQLMQQIASLPDRQRLGDQLRELFVAFAALPAGHRHLLLQQLKSGRISYSDIQDKPLLEKLVWLTRPLMPQVLETLAFNIIGPHQDEILQLLKKPHTLTATQRLGAYLAFRPTIRTLLTKARTEDTDDTLRSFAQVGLLNDFAYDETEDSSLRILAEQKHQTLSKKGWFG